MMQQTHQLQLLLHLLMITTRLSLPMMPPSSHQRPVLKNHLKDLENAHIATFVMHMIPLDSNSETLRSVQVTPIPSPSHSIPNGFLLQNPTMIALPHLFLLVLPQLLVMNLNLSPSHISLTRKSLTPRLKNLTQNINVHLF